MLALQGFSGTVTPARGPAHFHAHHDGEPAHSHAHVERHHHGAAANAIAVEDAAAQAAGPEQRRTVYGGFDTLPFPPARFPSLASRQAAHGEPPHPVSEVSFQPERPPAALRS